MAELLLLKGYPFSLMSLFLLNLQVTDSMMMVVEGEVINDPSAFVDSLVKDECLKTSREPVIGSLISVAISDGKCTECSSEISYYHAWCNKIHMIAGV